MARSWALALSALGGKRPKKSQQSVGVMSEHRIASRKRVLKAGTIEFGGGAIDCTVRNLSETGAALSVESPVGIPSEFNLIVAADKVKRGCKVAWRKENRIGISFLTITKQDRFQLSEYVGAISWLLFRPQTAGKCGRCRLAQLRGVTITESFDEGKVTGYVSSICPDLFSSPLCWIISFSLKDTKRLSGSSYARSLVSELHA